MDISFLWDRLCIIKLKDGKEYNCLKFDNLQHCNHVLKTVGIMTPALYEFFFFFSLRNVRTTYKNGLAFMLDDDAPAKLVVVENEEIRTLASMGRLGFSQRTEVAISFLVKHFDSPSDQCTESQAREESNQAVSMEGIEATANDQSVQTLEPTLTLMPNDKQNIEPNTFESNTGNQLEQFQVADCDLSEGMDADLKPDAKLSANASTQESSGGRPKKQSTKTKKKSASKQARKSPPLASCASKALDETNVCNTQEGEIPHQESQKTTPANEGPSKEFDNRSSRSAKTSSNKNDLDTPLVKNMTKSWKKAPRGSTPPDEVVWNTDPLTLNDFKPALKMAGFKFTEGCFALPNKHPSAYKDAKLGRDYFESEYDFRKHLCAFGLADCKDWDSETRDLLNIWVRYHIVDYEDRLPNISSSRIHNIWKTLTQIGFIYRYTQLGPRYCFPGDGGIEFDSEAACLEHIVRFGFPDNCDFSSMTDVEKTRFQMVVAESDRANTFEPISPDWDLSVFTSGVRTSTLKKRKRSPNPSPGIYSVTKKLEYRGSAKRARQGAPRSVSPKTPPRPTDMGGDPPSQSIGTPVHIPTTVTLSPAASIALPEFSGTDRERLQACLNALKLHHSIGLLCFDPDGTSSLRENLARVENFLTGVFKKRSRDSYDDDGEDDSTAALYVCGEPGVGKTSGVMYCCNKLKDEEAIHDFDVRVVKLNANDLKNTNDLHQELANPLNAKAAKKSIVLKLKGAHVSVKNKPPFLVVVVDEIDMMLSESDSLQMHRKSELVLKEMLEYASNPEFNFALIGISNSTGNHKYGRLHQLGKFQEVVTFKPYSVMDLQRILEVRVGHSVIAESALEAIAKKVAMSSGDARKALDAAARAVSECLKKTPEDVTTDQPLVKAVDTMKVFKSFEKNYKEVIEGQPTAGKVVMCIASVYAEKNQSVTLERLQELVTQTLVETGRLEEMLLSQDFKLIVENLADSGLLKTSLMNKQKKGRKKKADIDESTNSLIELQMPVGDVGALLAEEMKIPFYKTLRERAASKVN